LSKSRLCSRGNWDVGGAAVYTQQKQAKLWQTARCFGNLLADHTCRFDVARVLSKAIKRQQETSAKIEVPLASAVSSSTVQLGQSEAVTKYQLRLQNIFPQLLIKSGEEMTASMGIFPPLLSTPKLGFHSIPILAQTVAGTLQFPLAPDL